MKSKRAPKRKPPSLQQLREEALAEIGQAMRQLIPRACQDARAGKPALLRLASRWFRMPPMKELPEPPPHASRRERQLERDNAELRSQRNNAMERAILLEYKFGIRKKDDSPSCKKALDPAWKP